MGVRTEGGGVGNRANTDRTYEIINLEAKQTKKKHSAAVTEKLLIKITHLANCTSKTLGI